MLSYAVRDAGAVHARRRANTIHDLVEANRAAHKSRVARTTGQADRAVSTSVRGAAQGGTSTRQHCCKAAAAAAAAQRCSRAAGMPAPGCDTCCLAARARRVALFHRSAAASPLPPAPQVPDPQRLVPPITRAPPAPASLEEKWTCPHCRHVNVGARAECSRCRSPNPDRPQHHHHAQHAAPLLGSKVGHCAAASGPPGSAARLPRLGGLRGCWAALCMAGVPSRLTAALLLLPRTFVQDLLTASEEQVVRMACERHHPALNPAFADAGTVWANVSARPPLPPACWSWATAVCFCCPPCGCLVVGGQHATMPRCELPAAPALHCSEATAEGKIRGALLLSFAASMPPSLISASPLLPQGGLASDREAIRSALRGKRHERLMHIIHVLSSERCPAGACGARPGRMGGDWCPASVWRTQGSQLCQLD